MKGYFFSLYPLLFLIFLIFSFFLFQNCSFRIKGEDSESEFSISAIFETSEECWNSDFQSCIFFKNPFYSMSIQDQNNFSIKESWFKEDLSLFQIQAIDLEGLDSSGFLKNERFSVIPYEDERLSVKSMGENKLKFHYPSSELAQITAYYWTHRTLNLIESFMPKETIAHTETFQVHTKAKTTGWSSKKKSIYLGYDEQLDTAFSAETTIHLVAEASLFFQTNGAVYKLKDKTKHITCGFMQKDKTVALYKDHCCSLKRGCSKALIFGQGDYIVSLFFPRAPIVGESYAGSLTGLSYCGISRNLSEVRQKTAEEFFTACSEEGMPGQIFTMGIFYASLWWNIRQQALLEKKEDDVDKLFFLHLLRLNGDDDIITAFEKVRNLDSEIFPKEESLYSLFEEELKERGL